VHHAEPLSRERERLLELLPRLDLEDPAMAESVVFVAGEWGVQTDEIVELIRSQPASAAQAAVELERTQAAYIFELDWILAEIGVAQLTDATASGQLLQRAAMLDEEGGRRPRET
jgi:hypothetical protein